jgi:carboxylesterase type B
LDQLRNVPEETVSAATLPVAGIFVATGNPCDDGVFHAVRPSPDNNGSPPAWMKGYMVGDVYDEGMIFHESFCEDDFLSVRKRMSSHLGQNAADIVLGLYGITAELSKEEFVNKMEEMAGHSTFVSHNWIAAHRSKVPQTFGYHFDQTCAHESPLKGLAYHALDLLYLFLNFDEHFTEEQRKMARVMANHFLDFAYGKDPWPRVSQGASWMRYGPSESCKIVTEAEDEEVRKYSRMQKIIDMGVYEKFVLAVDEIAVKRYRMGTFEWKPDPIA